MRRRVLPFTVLVVLAHGSLAAQVCEVTDTIGNCFDRFKKTPSEAARNAAEVTAEDTLAAKTTGAESFASKLAATIKDFNPLFRGLIQTSDVAADGRSLTLDVNLKGLFDKAPQWQLQFVAHEPEVFEPLALALPASSSSALEDDLHDLDDVSAVVTWTPQGSRLGRSFSGNDDVFSKMMDVIAADVERQGREEPEPADLIFDVLAILGDDAPDDPDTLEFSGIEDGAKRAEVMKLVEAAGTAAANGDAMFRQEVESSRLIVMADLINNQPQFWVSGAYRLRDDIAGPDEISLKVSYEHGFANLNALRRKCGCSDAATLLPALKGYAASNATKSSLKHSDRLAFSLEYLQSTSYRFAVPADSVDLDLDSAHMLTASLSYGRYVSFDSKGNEVGRLDASAKYEEFGDDPMRQDRAVASIVYTQKLTDTWTLPIGVTWANREEFIGDVQEKLSAHVGVSYKLPWKH